MPNQCTQRNSFRFSSLSPSLYNPPPSSSTLFSASINNAQQFPPFRKTRKPGKTSLLPPLPPSHFVGFCLNSLLMAKRVLVTGGAGYIGTHTVLQLLLGGYRAVVVDSLDNSNQLALRRVQELAGKHAENLSFHQVDIRDKPALEKIFAGTKFDAVIHFAGLKAVGESVEKPLLYYNNNVIGTITLLEVMAAHGCKNLVFSSSATVYGWPKEVPCTEEFPISAMNPYGRTKVSTNVVGTILGDCVLKLLVIVTKVKNRSTREK
ncbi:unnamed protein product [Linum tenue]|uniref:UDP-glucose 4-epimerase n=1 Tax=Linum tenue TaxID=586396 RepID=A0AAV0M5Y5_9ROSI|nr:unnamed protein product [Linum tenue]